MTDILKIPHWITRRKGFYFRNDWYFNIKDSMEDFVKFTRRSNEYNSYTYYCIGLDYQNQNKVDLAIESYTKSINLGYNVPEIYNNRGFMYRVQENFESAMKDYNKAIEIKSDYADGYYNRSTIWMYLNEIDKAKSDMKKAHEYKVSFHAILSETMIRYSDAWEALSG